MYTNGLRRILLNEQLNLHMFLMNRISSYDIHNTIKMPFTKDIPLHERYETIDFVPIVKVKEVSITDTKVNKNIPFRERYETIDF